MENPTQRKSETLSDSMGHVQQVMREAHRAYPTRLAEIMDSASIDSKVGIGVKMIESISPVEVDGQEYFFYGARVFPKSEGITPFVKPHLHKAGEEPYFFPTMGGEMNFGSVINLGEESVEWREPFSVTVGSEVVIKPGEVHSFRNVGDSPVDFMFACPKSHLVDNNKDMPEGDRYIVSNFKNGIPPHYGV